MVLPDPIYNNSRSERIFRIHNRVGQIQPAGPMGELLWLSRTQYRYKVRRSGIAEVVPIASNPDLLNLEFLLVFDRLEKRIKGRNIFLQLCQFGMHRIQMLPPGA